jgi:hypothetical protein
MWDAPQGFAGAAFPLPPSGRSSGQKLACRAARKRQNRACKGQGPRAKGESQKGPGGGRAALGAVWRLGRQLAAEGPTDRSDMRVS